MVSNLLFAIFGEFLGKLFDQMARNLSGVPTQVIDRMARNLSGVPTIKNISLTEAWIDISKYF